MTDAFTTFLLTSAIGTALALVLMLLKPVTRKYFSANWNYYIWLVVLVVMMVPFKFNLSAPENLPSVTVNVINESNEEDTEEIIVEETPQISENVDAPKSNNITIPPVIKTETAPKKSISIFQFTVEFLEDNIILFAQLWVIGAVLLLTLKIRNYKKFLSHIMNNSKEIACTEIAQYTNEKIEVRVSNEAQSPFVVRWLKPVLILPDREITHSELKNILAHELAHIKRHDILYKWAVNIVKCVHWFNPCVYIIGKEIDKDCEISCDVKAVKNMSDDEKKAYADTILSLLSDKGQRMPLTTGMSGDKKTLKQRFAMIRNSKQITKKVAIISIVLVVVLSVITVFVSGILNGQLLEEEEEYRIHVNKPSEPIEINVISAADLKVDTYEKILEKYYKALSEKWDHNKMWDENLCYLAGLSKHTNPIENIGYCLMDVNGDNQAELLIGEISDGYWGMVIYDLYTVKNDEPYRILDSHERNRYILFEEDGEFKVANEGTESAAKAFTNYYAFDGSNLKLEKAVILDGTKTPESDQFTGFFVAYDDDFNTDNDTPIDQKTATEIMQSYEEKYITPKFIPFETLKEEAVPVAKEEAEEIIEKFYAADNFWIGWIYGQRYVTDRMSSSQNLSYGAVDDESPIQSKSELKKAMEEHFTKSLTAEFMSFLNPEDINGKLYIAYGDVGDNGESVEGVSVSKINDEKYFLTLDMYSYFEETSFTRYVYYIYEDGKWVFENDEMDKYFFHWQKHENIEYLPVMKKYYLALSQKWDVEAIDGISNIIASRYDGNPLENIGYSLMDINKDGIDELLIGVIKPEGLTEKDIYDLYTIKDGKAHQLAEGGFRDYYFLSLDDNGGYLIKRRTSGGGLYQTARTYRMNNTELEFVEGVVYDAHSYSVMPWFKVSEDGYEYDESISEETYDGIIETYEDAKKIVYPKYVPFETLD